MTFYDDLPSMIAKSHEIPVAPGAAERIAARTKTGRIRAVINEGATRAFYASNELHLYFQMDAQICYGDRIIEPWAKALAS